MGNQGSALIDRVSPSMILSYFEMAPRLEIKRGGHHQRRSKATNHVRDVRTAANLAATYTNQEMANGET
jgi:hypothetical protein